MTISAAVLDAMVAAGCTAEQIAAAVKADMAIDDERKASKRANNADRQRRHRERNAMSRVTGVSNGDSAPSSPLPLSSPPTPPPIIPHTPSPPSSLRSENTRISKTDFRSEFENQFWPIYPNKVGKPVALQAFVKARSKAELATIIDGLNRYVAKTDDRAWCNPSTWLNQERWNDRPAAVARGQPPPQHREPDLADLANERARQLREYDNGRTIEGSYERRDHDRDREAVPRIAASQGQAGRAAGVVRDRLPQGDQARDRDGGDQVDPGRARRALEIIRTVAGGTVGRDT